MTDDKGEAVLAPLQPTLLWSASIAAFPVRAFDYALFHRGNETGERPHTNSQDHEEPLRLTLRNARTVQVRVVDVQSKPMAGVSVYPWLFELPKKGRRIQTWRAVFWYVPTKTRRRC